MLVLYAAMLLFLSGLFASSFKTLTLSLWHGFSVIVAFTNDIAICSLSDSQNMAKWKFREWIGTTSKLVLRLASLAIVRGTQERSKLGSDFRDLRRINKKQRIHQNFSSLQAQMEGVKILVLLMPGNHQQVGILAYILVVQCGFATGHRDRDWSAQCPKLPCHVESGTSHLHRSMRTDRRRYLTVHHHSESIRLLYILCSSWLCPGNWTATNTLHLADSALHWCY